MRTHRRKTSSKYTELSRLTRGLVSSFTEQELPEHGSLLAGLLLAMAKKRASSVSVCAPLKKKKVSVEGGPSGARSVVHVLCHTGTYYLPSWESTTGQVVSCTYPTLSRGKGFGDY